MSEIFKLVRKVDELIVRKKLPLLPTRGRISVKAGLVLSLVSERTPDDLEQIFKLRKAVREVLGESV